MNSLQINFLKKQHLVFLLCLLFIASYNYTYSYLKYKELIKEEVFSDTFTILNIYDKNDFLVLKLKNSDFTFFTSVNKEYKFKKLDRLNITLLTNSISFYSYLKGFYTKSLYYNKPIRTISIKSNILNKLNSLHKNTNIQELFSALFLAIPISKQNREIYTSFGISHLIAISGFHLSIILFVVYWILFLPYSFIHKKYCIYRNIKADLLIMSGLVIFIYLYFISFVPSFLRAFLMFVFSFLLLRSNIKLISFQSLSYIVLFILSFYPEYLFSISLWFSVTGVFYIFLYLKYFLYLPKLFSFLFFNFWIFLAFNPIVHFFFTETSLIQLFSPLITVFFTLFYPFELLLHFTHNADFLDRYLSIFLNFEPYIYSFQTNIYFFVAYIICSFLSIFGKNYFILLNILLIIFTIKIYL